MTALATMILCIWSHWLIMPTRFWKMTKSKTKLFVEVHVLSRFRGHWWSKLRLIISDISLPSIAYVNARDVLPFDIRRAMKLKPCRNPEIEYSRADRQMIGLLPHGGNPTPGLSYDIRFPSSVLRYVFNRASPAGSCDFLPCDHLGIFPVTILPYHLSCNLTDTVHHDGKGHA